MLDCVILVSSGPLRKPPEFSIPAMRHLFATVAKNVYVYISTWVPQTPQEMELLTKYQQSPLVTGVFVERELTATEEAEWQSTRMPPPLWARADPREHNVGRTTVNCHTAEQHHPCWWYCNGAPLWHGISLAFTRALAMHASGTVDLCVRFRACWRDEAWWLRQNFTPLIARAVKGGEAVFLDWCHRRIVEEKTCYCCGVNDRIWMAPPRVAACISQLYNSQDLPIAIANTNTHISCNEQLLYFFLAEVCSFPVTVVSRETGCLTVLHDWSRALTAEGPVA